MTGTTFVAFLNIIEMDMALQNTTFYNYLPLVSYKYVLCLQITISYELCTSCFTFEWFIACVDTEMDPQTTTT